MTTLEVAGITAGYGDSRAVTDISFALADGEVLAIVGANGAGKSTLLRCIAGVHAPESGSVMLHGEDITPTPAFERNRRGISLVPEGRKLFPSLSVRENLTVGAGSGRAGQWNVDSVVAALPVLEPLLKRNASQLSGGQQQAVAIGRSLMSNPEVLLLDEVSLGLAPIVVDELYASIAGIRASGLSVLLVEQELARTLAIADRLMCMLEGHKVLEGTPKSLSAKQITDAYFGHAVGDLDDAAAGRRTKGA